MSYVFPPQGEEMFPTMLLIQKAIPENAVAKPASEARRNGTANREISSSAAPARSAAKRSKRAVHIAGAEKVNQIPNTSFGVHIFCDGACEPNPGSGGWGVVVYRDGRELAALSGGLGETTNNVMELTGMLQAIQWLIDHFMKDQPATIWCDSQYVVKGCNEWRHNWKRNGWSKRKPNSPKHAEGEIKNLDLWKAIDEALNKCSALTVAWVKGHVGIEGNERADELSLLGRRDAMDAARLAGSIDDYLDAEYRQIMGAA
jgi:ribonuclease HI